MKLNYFINCNSIDDAKQLYKKLAKEHHPDKGGDVEIMKLINNEYDFFCKKFSFNSDKSNDESNDDFEMSQIFKDAIKNIIHLDDLIIELVGSWIWVTGNTKKHKETLKASKFIYAKNKEAWFFRTDENKRPNKNPMDLEEIKAKYGTSDFKKSNFKSKELKAV